MKFSGGKAAKNQNVDLDKSPQRSGLRERRFLDETSYANTHDFLLELGEASLLTMFLRRSFLYL